MTPAITMKVETKRYPDGNPDSGFVPDGTVYIVLVDGQEVYRGEQWQNWQKVTVEDELRKLIAKLNERLPAVEEEPSRLSTLGLGDMVRVRHAPGLQAFRHSQHVPGAQGRIIAIDLESKPHTFKVRLAPYDNGWFTRFELDKLIDAYGEWRTQAEVDAIEAPLLQAES